MRPRLKFAHKILILGVTLIVVTAAGITGVNAVQFRARLYAREFAGAFTVYLAGLNYLAAHYKANRERFVRGNLDFVFENKFMRIDGAAEQPVKHLPDEVRIYDRDGNLVYEHVARGAPRGPSVLAPSEGANEYRQVYLRDTAQLRVSGPLTLDGSLPGFVVMYFPTALDREMRAFYAQSVGVMALISLGAILLSLIFARRVLQPIEVLTRAARKVHEGDLDQRVAVSTGDEIGMLGETFNQMISSLVRRIALMHRMQEWTVRISKQFDPALLFENLSEMFERMTQAGFSRLYVANPPGDALTLAHARGEPAADLRTEMAQQAHQTGRTQFRGRDGAIREDPEGAIEMALPLSIGSKRLGAVHLGPRADGAPFAEDTLTTVETLAQHAAMAIENAQLYQEVAERERVRQEMKWARDIQRALLPRAMPTIPGYEVAGVSLPALDVGGDYFDVVRTPRAWACIIGDVSGKGVPAALIMSIVRSLIHTYAEVSEGPKEILSRVNRKLTPDLEAEMFVTIAAVHVDPEKARVVALRAGHEPLLHVRANGTVVRLQAPGTAMGLTDPAVFDELLAPIEVDVGVGDALLLFTDGITEARNRGQEEIGYDRLALWAGQHIGLRAEEMVAALVRQAQEFSEGGQQADDITLLVIKRA
jgi:serine phosphatase RsbU (regulator of sigma subunit)/HAMP domain-containing protein